MFNWDPVLTLSLRNPGGQFGGAAPKSGGAIERRGIRAGIDHEAEVIPLRRRERMGPELSFRKRLAEEHIIVPGALLIDPGKVET